MKSQQILKSYDSCQVSFIIFRGYNYDAHVQIHGKWQKIYKESVKIAFVSHIDFDIIALIKKHKNF